MRKIRPKMTNKVGYAHYIHHRKNQWVMMSVKPPYGYTGITDRDHLEWWMWDCLLEQITWICLLCHIGFNLIYYPFMSYKIESCLVCISFNFSDSRCVTPPVSDFREDFRSGIDQNPIGNVHHWQPSQMSGFLPSQTSTFLSVAASR